MVELEGYSKDFNETFATMVKYSDLETTTKYNDLDNVYEVDEQFAYVELKSNYREILADTVEVMIREDDFILDLIDYLENVIKFLTELEYENSMFTLYGEDGNQYYTKINLEKTWQRKSKMV